MSGALGATLGQIGVTGPAKEQKEQDPRFPLGNSGRRGPHTFGRDAGVGGQVANP